MNSLGYIRLQRSPTSL